MTDIKCRIARSKAVELAKEILRTEEETMTLAEQELDCERLVIKALLDLNKPPGLPESWYYSDAAEKWLKGLIKDAVREVLTERLYRYPQPNWWQPDSSDATNPPNHHIFDDYSPFNNRMTRRQRDQKEKEDEG